MTERTEAAAGGEAFPSGIVTFLFTDVEGSTRLWAEDRDAMSASLEAHDRLLRQAVEARGGYVFTTAGDSFAVAFSRASDAVAAALQAQEALAETEWPGPALKVRMGLHLGEAQERAGDYFGPVVNTTARLESAGHGGQVLLTDPVRQAAEVTVKDLGVHQLRDVAEPVQVWQLGDSEFPSLRVVDAGSTNLPVAATGLVGRLEDLREVRAALSSSRVVTLTAGGGTGKTRLAVAAGDAELPHRADGVWFVDLTPVSDGALVGPAVAAGLGLSLTVGDPTEQVLDYVAGKDLLLIIDNCEHLIDECAEFAERFIAQAGASRLLATSRERLDVDGEQVVVVPPLPVDDEHSAAVELFARRAAELDSSFTLSDDDRAVIMQLCRRLDGMPLAIELAAARSPVMSPRELLAGIEDRFQLLHGGRRRQRQRTLEATLDWSYNLLEDGEQRVFRSLGVFVGTFDLAAVAAVNDVSASSAVEMIDSLIAKSLVIRQHSGEQSRFRLFETTAAYAQQRLVDAGEAIPVRERHLDHYFEIAGRHPAAMWADLSARETLGVDRANVVAAFDWAASQDRWEIAARLLLGGLAVFYTNTAEGIDLVRRCLEHLDHDNDLAVRLRSNEYWFHLLVLNYPATDAIMRRLRDAPTPVEQFQGYLFLANAVALIDSAKGTEILKRAFEIKEKLPPGLDKTLATAACAMIAGIIATYNSEWRIAVDHAQEALRLHTELGLETEISALTSSTGAVSALLLGDPETALQIMNGSQQPSAFGAGDEIRALAYVALGDIERARDAVRAQVRVAVAGAGRIPSHATNSLLLLAVLSYADGDTTTARELVLNMGRVDVAGLAPYSWAFADELEVSADFMNSQHALVVALGDEVRRRANNDLETLRLEITRRDWA